MNHNYKLTDFKRLEDETEKDIINEPITIYLRSKFELPTELKVRLENTINNLITEYEQANSIEIPLEKMNTYLTFDIKGNQLYTEVFIGCDLLLEMLYNKEDISENDKDYAVIKKFFFDRLINYAAEKKGN